MQFKTESNGKEIIYSSTFIPFSFSEPEIFIRLHEKVNIRLVLQNDINLSNNIINTKVDLEKSILTITGINFNNSLGTISSVPIHIGTLNNRKIYLAFAGYDINSAKVVHVTIYQDLEEIKDGQQ